MSRYLVNNETKKKLEYKVKALIITRNFWEHFIFDCPDIPKNDDVQFALVMGFETELGYVSISELKPHALTVTKITDENVQDTFPPEGYSWAN